MTRIPDDVVVRVDKFFQMLQRDIQRKQTRRTELLNELEALNEEIEIMEKERDGRDIFLHAVPDFPPGQPQQTVLDLSDKSGDPKVIQMETEEALIEFAQLAPKPTPKIIKTNKAGFQYHAGALHPDNDNLHPNLQGVAFKSSMFKDLSYNLARMFVVEWREKKGAKTWFSRSDLSAIGVPPTVATKRLQDLLEEGIIEWNGKVRGGSRFRFRKPDPQKPEPKMRRVPPERTKPAYTEVTPGRGEAVRLTNHGKKGTTMQTTGRARTKMKQKDREYAKQVAAREERSEKDKAKAPVAIRPGTRKRTRGRNS